MLELRDTTSVLRGLLFNVADEVRDEVKAVVHRQSLTTSQASALVALEEPMTMRSLAERARCDPSSVTYIVDKLEEAGLVERTPHPTDRRSKVIVATDEGARARAAIITEFSHASVLSRLDQAELDQLESLLAKLTA
ncbi:MULTISPECIES: MarR family winged helix-turn-helix transcriptional regulator [Microbacterium]|uniref:MarR family winged helix-turn-helix transcriptional regulator n=1 Tax=Microbacterium TaxID=33882 RepID=UPI0018B07FD0|nr:MULTISPECIES: MarR family transcriptional regulator [Microbacterium]MBF9335226.1 MarR family transcriptional regulator [Microbacterium lacticum]MBM7752538.1 DNA-binding MarR family transcriptional regulator [Microbacterium laevaniformans]GLJ63393.1 MarR family transcriptional regulator [Microbacterium laevaniformans]